MILLDIKHYVAERKQVSLGDIALHFGMEPATLQGLLAHWVKKGKVIKSEMPCACNRGCSGCGGGEAMEIYQWRE